MSSVRPSRTMLQDSRLYGQNHNDFEDAEYRQLPSPTRSSLRSPERSKEGFRVTFADRDLSDVTLKKDSFMKTLLDNDTVSPTKLHYGSTDHKSEALFAPRDSTLHSFKSAYIKSTPPRKESSENKNKDQNIPDDIGRHSEQHKDLEKHSYEDKLGSSNERLLRLSSDLYFTTHLTDPSLTSNTASTLRKGYSSFSKNYALPSKPTYGKSHMSTKLESHSEFTRDLKKPWSPDAASDLIAERKSTAQTGMKRTSSLNSLTHKPAYERKDNNNEDLLYGNRHVEAASPLGLESASLSDVLQRLTDLVDRYWNGSGSLLQNQRFLLPARELLSNLIHSSSGPQASHMDNGLQNMSANCRVMAGNTEGDNLETLKQKLLKVMEENRSLQSKIYKLENNSAYTDASGILPSSQAELWHRLEKLTLEVASFQQQLKESDKMSDTLKLLHESQRSLVNTNEYLLQQLNAVPPHYTSKDLYPTKQISKMDKYVYSEASKLSIPPPQRSAINRSVDRLSTSPL
ncbi:leucine-rich repeat-containing protein 36 [Bombina bombina]|uniref:leucine-rich repeat-containing protein 36 n=1 Tax=Bombina bombina TaxID=8345 RepID=UPI00235AB6FB|nr:leucine-rich repeat-containing protein 36 [Bombina bombina]